VHVRVVRRLVAVLSLVLAVTVCAAGAAAGAGAAPRHPLTAAGGRAPTHDPVLLVHGFDGSGASWHTMVARLRAAGYRADEIDAMSYASTISNVAVAHRIAGEVTRLLARTGARRVDVVSHSMGAISSRYYLEDLGGAAHVDAWVSLAGVNRGTIWAYGCYAIAPCREMVPTSSLLAKLNTRFPPAGTTRYGVWWSPCDDAVVPRVYAELPGATNTETACLGHSAITSDPTVLSQVLRFLAGPSRPA